MSGNIPEVRNWRKLDQIRLVGVQRAALGAGQAGPRERARRGGAGGALGARGQLGGGGRRADLVGPEDVLLGLAGEQRFELGLLDRLALDEDLRDRLERVAVLVEDV